MTMIKLLAAATVSLILTSTLATAGGHDTLGSSPVATTASSAQGGQWNGAYFGLSGGSATNLEYDNENFPIGDGTFEDSDSFGVFIGTLSQQNGFVFGAELEFLSLNDPEGPSDQFIFESLLDLKAIGGVPVGDALLYGILGVSIASGEDPGNYAAAGGFGFGVGAAYKIGPDFSIGAEYLTRSMAEEFSDTTVDVTAETITVRAAYHF